MSPVRIPPGQHGKVGDLVMRYQAVIERARVSNVSPDAVFEVLRMEAAEWSDDQITDAIERVRMQVASPDAE